MSWARAVEELAKCQLLCRAHHERKSLAECGGPSRHGTISRYKNHGCCCTECIAGARSWWREYRMKNPRRKN